MKRLLFIPLFLIFISYWSATILFNLPDNYINISFLKQEQKFDKFFFQKWGFFAPPPKFNDRLYYNFYSKKDTFIFEVLEPLNLLKQKKAPFNSNEDLLDYVISNSVSAISDDIIELNLLYSNDSTKINDSLKTKEITSKVRDTYCFKTLKNYSQFVANKNGLKFSDYKYQILITRKNLPKFSERFLDLQKGEEMIFKSEILN